MVVAMMAGAQALRPVSTVFVKVDATQIVLSALKRQGTYLQRRPHADVGGRLHFLTRVTSSVFSASVVKHLVANSLTSPVMPRFYEPDLGTNPDSPFARDASGKLIRPELLAGYD
jgi:hypothetical protein